LVTLNVWPEFYFEIGVDGVVPLLEDVFGQLLFVSRTSVRRGITNQFRHSLVICTIVCMKFADSMFNERLEVSNVSIKLFLSSKWTETITFFNSFSHIALLILLLSLTIWKSKWFKWLIFISSSKLFHQTALAVLLLK
jgi:hypothetical protein